MERGLRVLVADDDIQMQIAIKSTLERSGHEVTVVTNGIEALTAVDQEPYDVIISDQRMPEMGGQELLQALQSKGIVTPLILITAYGTINQAVEAMQLGAADFITKPFSLDELERVIERVCSADNRMYRQEKSRKQKRGRPIISNDQTMKRVLEVAEAVARSDATVLIQGESGTGKELIARLVHSCSARANGPFVAVNCAALPETLLESELFGHEKGSFTGAATRKIGKFELAHGGTILLDEISEMELPLQAKLLRVLQEREVDRVGGQAPIAIDVRVLATTNRRLDDYVAAGKFRSDLYYRLNVIPITLPPLRERRGDIKLLIEFFMKQFLGDKAPPLNQETLRILEAHSWPGNIRELQNAVERAAILAQGGSVSERHFMLPGAISGSSQITPKSEQESSSSDGGYPSLAEQIEVQCYSNSASSGEGDGLTIRSGMTVGEMERKLIFETLKATGDNRTQAAKLLGISIRTLRNKLNEYRIQ